MIQLKNLVHDNGDVDVVRASLIGIKVALNTASYDYAHAALDAAQEACEAALAEAPCVIVWQHISEYQKYTKKAQESWDACTTSIAMLLEVEETGNPEIDRINASVKLNSLEKPVIDSLLEGANSRIQVAVKTMPENPAPGAMCDPKRLSVTDDPT